MEEHNRMEKIEKRTEMEEHESIEKITIEVHKRIEIIEIEL